MIENAEDGIKSIYEAGESDIILFGYIIGIFSREGKDEDCDESVKRLRKAIEFTKFLVDSGDFVVGRTSKLPNGEFRERNFEEFDKFVSLVTCNFRKGGIADVDLLTETWIKKISPAPRCSVVPAGIERLFTDHLLIHR